MITNLQEGERLDDLECKGYQIIQKKDGFCFGTDAVLLSSFVTVRESERVLDMGTGTGVIPILLEAKTKGKQFIGLEIQQSIADMAGRSVAWNHLEDKIQIRTGDIKEASKLFGGASFHVVTSNPPYMPANTGLKNPNETKAISRHEIYCTLDDVVREASKVLKANGRFYMVHRPQRLGHIMEAFIKYKMKLRRLQMVHPMLGKEASLVLIEAVKYGNPYVVVEEPIILYERPGVFTHQYEEIYGKNRSNKKCGC